MMDPRLHDLYLLPWESTPEEIYLQDLAAYCACLEDRVRSLADSLPSEDRALLESYLDLRDELEFQSVKRALKIAKAKTTAP